MKYSFNRESREREGEGFSEGRIGHEEQPGSAEAPGNNFRPGEPPLSLVVASCALTPTLNLNLQLSLSTMMMCL